MASISTIVDLIHPGSNATGIVLGDEVWVLFDREIDEDSINAGNFFIEGPDTDSFIGPPINAINLPNVSNGDDPLTSPGYKGIVQGTFSFERINLLDTDLYTGPDDTTGLGNLWRTKAIFTPTNRLQKLTDYTVYLSGDEDELATPDTGIKSRTIFDTVDGVGNTGTGIATFAGSYTGSAATDTYTVTITTAGAPGIAKFTWFRTSAPLSIHGPFLTEAYQNTPLENGVEVNWEDDDLNFLVGDTFSAFVKQPELFTDNMYWSFTTGSGSIVNVPEEASTSVIGTIASSTEINYVQVTSTSPVDRSSNLDPALTVLTVTFNVPVTGPIPVTITGEPVNGDETILSNITFTESITNTPVLSLDGLTLTITLGASQLFENNLIVITIDKDDIVSVTDSLSLAEDFVFWFTTTYNPLYSSIRKVRLEIGSFIKTIPDDVINFAIYEASIAADQLSWVTANPQNKFFLWARREWVTCKAAQILLMNIMGVGGLKSKRLDNLEVVYDQMHAQHLLNKIDMCLNKWILEIQSGGKAVQTPIGVVKGELDPDDTNVGRMWEKGPYVSQQSGANLRYRPMGSRRYIAGWRKNWTSD